MGESAFSSDFQTKWENQLFDFSTKCHFRACFSGRCRGRCAVAGSFAQERPRDSRHLVCQSDHGDVAMSSCGRVTEPHSKCRAVSIYLRHYLLLSKREYDMMIPVGNPKSDSMTEKADVLQGTLTLMTLKTLEVLGPLHGYGIARRIEQISGDLLAVNQGTLYPLLLKLGQEGAISSEWGASENNRRARFYRLTRSGRKLLETETRDWEQSTIIIARFFEVKAEDFK
jgi:PadR family transcriptional regulator PadR